MLDLEQKRKTEISKQEIIESALPEFSKYKYNGASINRICQNGNISKGRLYHHYASKEQIYIDCIIYCFNKLGKYLDAFVPNSEENLESNILTFFKYWQKFWNSNTTMIKVLVESRMLPPDEIKDKIIDIRTDFIATSIKHNISKIVAPYFPEDNTKQTLLVNMTWIAIDYIAVAIGASSVPSEGDLTAFFEKQYSLFERTIHIFLYGCLEKN